MSSVTRFVKSTKFASYFKPKDEEVLCALAQMGGRATDKELNDYVYRRYPFKVSTPMLRNFKRNGYMDIYGFQNSHRETICTLTDAGISLLIENQQRWNDFRRVKTPMRHPAINFSRP